MNPYSRHLDHEDELTKDDLAACPYCGASIHPNLGVCETCEEDDYE